MQYLVSFLEGIITFISPCLLPMLPIYVGYFAAGEEKSTARTLKNALGFVLGFTIVFVAMGALAGSVGSFVSSHSKLLNLICGIVVIFFGLYYLGVFKFNIFKGSGKTAKTDNLGFFSSMIFGIVFSVGWTPCVGVFLGSALALASQQSTMLKGMIMLLFYSAGLGFPFVISAVLIDRLKGAFDAVKRHYKTINIICGIFLIVIGILMASGLLGRLLGALS